MQAQQVHGEIAYDLPPADGEGDLETKQRRDMHRRREEAAVRALDGVASAEHRASTGLIANLITDTVHHDSGPTSAMLVSTFLFAVLTNYSNTSKL